MIGAVMKFVGRFARTPEQAQKSAMGRDAQLPAYLGTKEQVRFLQDFPITLRNHGE
jgi:hypothetical protein